MFLKRLEIQGYKSFANRTEFVFNGGVTAIVGPNGSGKSNIADAIRWALGEQSFGALRAKRTEDLVFSGSAERPRLGLAEASLVLDNSTRWLPLDYSDITITRRAYRSGENEYYINGARVRLRDIMELLGRAGLTRSDSVVIGQGQVDAALSLRPEERRLLLEEAAGIRMHIAKRDEALRRLEETRHNLERLNDILNEITPRLENLQRQAERTREHDAVKRDLEAALLQWYGYQWHRHHERLAATEQQLAERSRQVESLRARIQATAAERETLRQRQQAIRAEIARRRQEAEQLRSRHEEQRRRAAVLQERLRSVQRQLEQAQSDLAGAEARCEELRAAVARHEEQLAALATSMAEQQAAASAAKAVLSSAEAALKAQRDELERARSSAFDMATAQAAARNRLTQLERRHTELQREMGDQAAAVAQAEERMAAAASELEAAEADHQSALEALSASEREYHRAEDELAQAVAHLDQLRSERDATREAYQSLSTQLEVLRRARSQALHLHSGSQVVIREGLPGVVGTVASLVAAPRELEAAIEAALGAHLQDVVVRTWDDAVACIEHLKRTEGGRATFLPLDYIRPHQPVPAPRTPGVRGIAARLVKCEPELRPVCDLLLGNIVIVDDLAAGRKALSAEPRLRQAVTLDADVIEARGVMRGGSRPRGRSVLSQEREWRDLPARLAEAERALAEAEARVHAEEEKQQAARARVRECAQRMQSCRETATQEEQRANVLRQRYHRLLQDLTWRRSLEEQARRSLDDLQVEIAQVQGELGALESSLADVRQRIEELRSQVEREDLESLRRQVAESETALAITVRTRHAEEQLKASQAEALARAVAETQARRSQLDRLRTEAASLAQESESLHQALEAAEQARQAVAGPLAEAEASLQAIEEQRARLEAEEDRDRQQLQALLSDLNRLSFERERASEEIDALRRQIESDLGPVEVPDPGHPTQLRLNLGPEATPLPSVPDVPEGLSAQVKELRARLRRLGPVNPSAPAEYEEVLERHRFLSEQIADLSAAADSARQIIADLNQLIRDRFTETFAQVAREFSACFTALFNGGSARLVLTDPDNPAESGIDIVARPPGKRQQGLALLSGGERALTAVALLFAMLKVNPMPFCVLDEVDATLDEANVRRFRQFLSELAQKTQFIVITHNRATVESASTIYGISMTRAGVSQVLSLAIPEKEGAEEARAEPAA